MLVFLCGRVYVLFICGIIKYYIIKYPCVYVCVLHFRKAGCYSTVMLASQSMRKMRRIFMHEFRHIATSARRTVHVFRSRTPQNHCWWNYESIDAVHCLGVRVCVCECEYSSDIICIFVFVSYGGWRRE